MYSRHKFERALSRVMALLALFAVALAVWPHSIALALDGTDVAADVPVLVSSQPVTSGVRLLTYDWTVADGPARVRLMKIDLQNPNVQVEVIPGGGKITERATVSEMAERTGAVAAVNADFFSTQAEGAPIGPMVIAGEVAASPSVLRDLYALGITAERTAQIESFSFSGRVISASGQEFALSGLNKATYWEEPTSEHSHANKLHLYNDTWGGQTRGQDSYTTPTELLVEQGKVIDISRGKYFAFAVPEGKQILRGHGTAAKFLESFQIGDSIDIDYTLTPDRDWSMIVGGHSLLVDQGKAVPYARYSAALDGVRARSAAGVSEDGHTLYLLAVEGHTASSAGLTLANLAAFLETQGVWRALNLDGGGSTTMVARPLGDSDATQVFAPEQLSERRVVNAIGIYSKAPTGKLQGLLLDGADLLLIGEQVDYRLRAYDQYFNPLQVASLGAKWAGQGTAGRLQGSTFTADQPGEYRIRTTVGSIQADLPLEVVGKHDLSALQLSGDRREVVSGSEVRLGLTLNSLSGKSREVPAGLVDWQCYGFTGRVSPEGVLTVQNVGAGAHGFLVARYQGYSAPLPLQFASERSLERLDTLANVTYSAQPAEVTGKLSLVADPDGQARQVTRLDYDFAVASGTAAAYLQFAAGSAALEAGAQALLLDVYGNGNGEWLRAELQDASGAVQRVDLATNVNWVGWRTLQVDLTGLAAAAPLSLKRIYPVVTVEQRSSRPLQGTLHFRNLRLKFAAAAEEPLATPNLLQLTVGERTITVDGVVSAMDVAPVIVGDRTFVPLRFISEALLAQVIWEGATKNATIIQDSRWIDLWPGDNLMVVDGGRVELDVPPQLISNRTMLPLRAVAQALNLNVQWDPTTRQITLQK